MTTDSAGEGEAGFAAEANHLSFEYDNPYGTNVPALKDINFQLPRGARCLLLGANGAGKSTLLRLLAGKHLHEENEVLVLGKPAFYQTLGVSGVSYLGGGWTRTVAFAGNNVPYQADIPVSEMMQHLQNQYPERRDKLYEILEIDPTWRMHQVSDGQRRRVQIMLGLLRPFKLLLLDEMTVDLDVLARADFLRFLTEETEERKATIIYATHIFDGLGEFPTHMLMLEAGELVRFDAYQSIRAEPTFQSLYGYVVDFLREMQEERKKLALTERQRKAAEPPPPPKAPVEPFADRINSGYTPGRMAAYQFS
mmetsp:Transcript_8755/g.20364  ORF Transcript_8755/g.20364 Transcript_8755/m.20364 type:complete len:309 (-) Transcript_8755:198-1124(-)|eukprot:CAMPEP_0202038314 /NCGR_PEP_ID=MMETSP0962-20130828/8743_1 /ASSEMBLY_ACC=CAM_ASM_000488 /TAXON_ID=4773 /ORGANISM="Schizochytrium aggregatum, Strain ATCC28209" /LENGTH=308 /DNA_ID=CAMNT_0048602467 /DNA_START=121 /DNA_END=1047 /DNA_ORIENTATION=+